MIDPRQVAEAILAAAVKPARDVKMGMMAKVNTFVAKNLPGIADRMAARQVQNLQRDEPEDTTPGRFTPPAKWAGRTAIIPPPE